ncbi:MAG TPA: MinD/ParA family protein [Desulfitobacteriaceae bacterium]|jgi:flagellar biosynthesis protein FlhG|nr:MinD/ParA family protein [Desulfitobacteriaceae bacterium]
MHDQAAVLRELSAGLPVPKTKMRVISVSSGKGGVGKTNFTVNFALALVELGYRVIILDGDFGMANVDIAFGITPRYSMEHLIAGEKTIEEILLAGPKGIGILPGGSGVREMANLERSQLQNVLANFGRLEKYADILLIDTGAGLSNTVLNFLRASDEIILVTTPEPTSLTDAYGLVKVLDISSEEARVGIVVNRVHSEAEARDTYERLETAVKKFLSGSLNLLGWVYDDPQVGRAVMSQEPVGLVYPDSSAYKCIQWIAGTISGLYLQAPRRGIRGFLKSLLNNF